jgi:hypothetical protein
MVSAAEHEADLRSRGDDPTPRGVVRAVLEAAVGDFAPMHFTAASDHLDGLGYAHPGEEQSRVTRVLDVCAGYGCWASEMRRLAGLQGWPVHITGVELDERKREHLAKWCDEVIIRDWFDALRDHHEPPTYDLAIGNPDFAQLLDKRPADDFGPASDPACSMPAVLLEHAPAVLLLHTQQAFLKSEAGRAAWRAYPPAASWLIPGGVKFRGAKQGADSRCYQVTLWLRDHKGPCAVHLLGDLTPAERSWTTLPGTEDAETARALGLPMVGCEHG